MLWPLVEEAESHGTLVLFLWMVEWIRAQSAKGEAHHESRRPPRCSRWFFSISGFGHVGIHLCLGRIEHCDAAGSVG
jgi:hypothetical protein